MGQDIDPHLAALQGVCPNTGHRCDRLIGVNLLRAEAVADFRSDYTSCYVRSEAFEYLVTTASRINALSTMAINGSCDQACALKGIDLKKYIEDKA